MGPLMKRETTLATIALLTLVACNPPGPMTGGPCTYETSVIEAIAVTVDTDGAVFDSAEGEFWVSAAYLPAQPAPGETLTLQRESILTGTCTPLIFTVIEPAEPG